MTKLLRHRKNPTEHMWRDDFRTLSTWLSLCEGNPRWMSTNLTAIVSRISLAIISWFISTLQDLIYSMPYKRPSKRDTLAGCKLLVSFGTELMIMNRIKMRRRIERRVIRRYSIKSPGLRGSRHDYVMTGKPSWHYWPFVSGIHRSPVIPFIKHK